VQPVNSLLVWPAAHSAYFMKEENLSKNFAGIYRDRINQIKGSMRTVLREIISNCNHADNPSFVFENIVLPLKRGQRVTSLKRLHDDTGLSVQQIRTALKNLENLKILTDRSTDILTNRARLITIVDIDYWLIKAEEVTNPLTEQLTDRQQTPNKPLTTNNNDSNNETNNEVNKTTEQKNLPPAVEKKVKEKKPGFKTIDEIFIELKNKPRENLPKYYWQQIAKQCVSDLNVASDSQSTIFGYFKKNMYLAEAIYRYMLERPNTIDNATGYFLSEWKRRINL
jgi:hypothetical protein